MVSSRLLPGGVVATPMAESEEKQDVASLLRKIRRAQQAGAITAPMPIDTLEVFVDPLCDAECVSSVLDLHDRYRRGEDVGELDKVTQLLFVSQAGKAMMESIEVVLCSYQNDFKICVFQNL